MVFAPDPGISPLQSTLNLIAPKPALQPAIHGLLLWMMLIT